jgi:apolipoprotein D and lipocalin family protein
MLTTGKNMKKTLLSCLCALSVGCSSMQPIKTVDYVNLEKFMGDWYVIACIPTFIEKEVYNGIESYQLAKDGTIDTTFTFKKGGFDGVDKKYQPKGFVVPNTGNAIWGMQFIWPIKAEYRIVHLDPDYQTTIIARNARDYVWLMARNPTIDEALYISLVKQIKDMGYDTEKLVKIPQQWPNSLPKRSQ